MAGHLPVGEQNRVNNTADLARKFGRALAWARRARLATNSSATRTILAACIDHILTKQVLKASSASLLTINNIFLVLCELKPLVEQTIELLVDQENGTFPFITLILQDSVTAQRVTSSPLIDAKYVLFHAWLTLQRNLLISWLCFAKLPTHPSDFWIERNTAEQETTELGSRYSQDKLPTNSVADVWHEFHVAKPRLPVLFISEAVAAKILFIGIAVKIFLSNSSEKRIEHELFIQKMVASMFMLTTPATASLGQTSKESDTGTANESMNVGFRTFFGHWNSMEAAAKVTEMEKWAAHALYMLITQEHRIASHFQVLREFFFLQDGFFYRTFFALSTKLMRLPPGMSAEHDINLYFQESAVSKQFLGEDSKSRLFQNFRLTFTPSYLASNTPATNDQSKPIARTWTNLCLDYSVSWPLNLILEPSVLRQYNDIFQFLFQVKRLQIGIQHAWNILRAPHLQLRLSHRFQMLRLHMGFFIDTLSQYLQVDVLSSQFQTFDKKLENCQDFEDLQSAHQHFLAEVCLQCFLTVPAFRRTFAQMFDLIHNFVLLTLEYAGDPKTNTPGSSSISLASIRESETKTMDAITKDLESLMKEWAKHSNLLFTLLSGVKGQAQHLHYLILLLDYNMLWSEGLSIMELESSSRKTDEPIPEQTRMAHIRSTISTTTMLTTSSEQSSFAPDATSSKLRVALTSGPQTTGRLKRATSAGTVPVGSAKNNAGSSGGFGGPRPELLARLMKKTNK